jgi:polysaccharide export outer membrane protein
LDNSPDTGRRRVCSAAGQTDAVFDAPDLSGHFRVDEKGGVNVPLLGHIHIAGETAEEAARTIEQHYVEAEILKPSKAYVTVFISEYATQGIVVGGEVKSSGVYPALGVRMLNDVITAAGGLSPTAASKVIITRKDDPDNPITVAYNPEALKPVIPRIQIFPGDSIMVPRAGIIYVMGNVIRPGGYPLDGRSGLTVEEAMALAGGDKHAAALTRAQLVRTLDDGRREDIIVNVKAIQKGIAADVAMKDGDVLFVPTSNARLVTEQVITAAVGIGSNVVIYRTAVQ